MTGIQLGGGPLMTGIHPEGGPLMIGIQLGGCPLMTGIHPGGGPLMTGIHPGDGPLRTGIPYQGLFIFHHTFLSSGHMDALQKCSRHIELGIYRVGSCDVNITML